MRSVSIGNDEPASTVEWLARVGEISRLVRAYQHGDAVDQPGRPSEALKSYLRAVSRDRNFTAAAVVVWQVRELLDEDWDAQDTLEAVDFLGLPQPSDGRSARDWLGVVADLIEQALEASRMGPEAMPSTQYDWTAAFPDAAAVIGNAFHQDAIVLHTTLERALAETLRDFSVFLIARAVGQFQELLTLG